MSNHTPGPWDWSEGWNDPIDLTAYDRPKYADLQLFGGNGEVIIPIRIDHAEPIYDVDSNLSLPSKADRILIAAAPEMLEALKRALLNMDRIDEICALAHVHPFTKMRSDLEAAIRKAEGKG